MILGDDEYPRGIGLAGFVLTPPGTPFGHYDGGDIDGSGNTTLTPGQTLTSWVDLGTGGNNLAVPGGGNGPSFQAPLDATKLSGRAGVLFDSSNTECFQVVYGAPIAQPQTIAVVWAHDTLAISQSIYDGLQGGNRHQLVTSSVGPTSTFKAFTIFGAFAATLDFRSASTVYNTVASSANVDGVSVASGVDCGVELWGALTLGCQVFLANPLDGRIAEVLVYNSVEALGPIDDYFAGKYGTFPQ